MSSRMVFKITVLGDGGVGKTALTVQFTMSSFVEAYDPTIEDCYRKQWVVDEQPCLLEVLDTAGQEEYTALRDQWIRDGEGFLVVYSIASRSTFERIERIVERVHRVKDDSALSPYDPYASSARAGAAAAAGAAAPTSPGARRARIPVVIVGNKRDAYGEREVSTEEGRALAAALGCDFYETSARLNQNVEQAFKSLVRQIKAVKRGPEAPGVAAKEKRERRKRCVIL
ncbi:RAS2 protein [Cryptotrichosporon argae]